MNKPVDTKDFGMELLLSEQARDLAFFKGKECMLEKLEVTNAPEDKLASFLALFARKDA